MDEEQKAERDPFLSRWSRLKKEAREAPTAAPSPAVPEARADEPAPELPPLDKLTIDSDFRGFFHPKVDEDVRRAALRKLFAEPHFNVMDGLDTYIDDYSKTEPIPAAMLAGMKQAQRILDWAKGKEDEPEPEDGTPEAALENEAQEANANAQAEQNEIEAHTAGETRAIDAPDGDALPDINRERDALPRSNPEQT